jgi:hypothetical protein
MPSNGALSLNSTVLPSVITRDANTHQVSASDNLSCSFLDTYSWGIFTFCGLKTICNICGVHPSLNSYLTSDKSNSLAYRALENQFSSTKELNRFIGTNVDGYTKILSC